MTGVHKIEQFLINEGKDAFFLLITRYGRFHDIQPTCYYQTIVGQEKEYRNCKRGNFLSTRDYQIYETFYC